MTFFAPLLNPLRSWKSFKVYRFECILSFLLSHDRHQAISEIPSWHFFWWWIMSLPCKTIHVEPYKRRQLFNMVVGYYCYFLYIYSLCTEIFIILAIQQMFTIDYDMLQKSVFLYLQTELLICNTIAIFMLWCQR